MEQVEGLTIRYGRYTPLLLGVLQAVGLALAGRAGVRLLLTLHAVVSRVSRPQYRRRAVHNGCAHAPTQHHNRGTQPQHHRGYEP